MYRLRFHQVQTGLWFEEEYSSVECLLNREEELSVLTAAGREEYNNFSLVKIAR